MTACFVAIDAENRIAGYYTLASASMLLSELPADIGKKLPRYPSVPAVRLGRLAVDQNFQGQGLGGALLADALDRAIRPEIAACAMVVNAKDDRAAMFYHHHGFIILPTAKMTLFYTLNRKFNTSPSLTTYSLPSARILPASLAPCSPLQAMKSS